MGFARTPSCPDTPLQLGNPATTRSPREKCGELKLRQEMVLVSTSIEMRSAKIGSHGSATGVI
jgi:hypothetical protein